MPAVWHQFRDWANLDTGFNLFERQMKRILGKYNCLK